MNEDPSLPQPFSRMEIATIAAMLLGKFATDGEYRSACESALNLLTIAEEVAHKYDPEKQNMANPFLQLLDHVEIEPSPDLLLQEQLLRLGFKNGSKLAPESENPLPWDKFWREVLHPPKPSNMREKNFKAWLLSKVSKKEVSSILHNLKGQGVPKKLVIMYLREFPSWWKDYNSRRNSVSAKEAAEKRKNAGK